MLVEHRPRLQDRLDLPVESIYLPELLVLERHFGCFQRHGKKKGPFQSLKRPVMIGAEGGTRTPTGSLPTRP